VADVERSAPLILPCPEITLSADSALPGDTISITGSAFSGFANVDTINIGQAPALPTPNPRTDALGDFSAAVVVPALNPGAYTITVRTGPGFTATAPIRILSGGHDHLMPPEVAFQALISRGLLTLAVAAPPGGTGFGAYVPGLPGDTLAHIEPNGVLVLTLAKDARISVSGQPAVDVTAGTPTFFALGSVVSVDVIEVTVTPSVASTGEVLTISGTGFPPRTTLSEARFGPWNALPVPAPATDVNGNIVVMMTVPSCSPGASSCLPPPYAVCVTVAGVVGCTEFTIPQPSITLSADMARPGDVITITGSIFSLYTYVDTINIGQTSVTPTPNTLTDGFGSFTASITVPALNPGAYTVTVRTGAHFAATAPILILGKNPKPPEEAFQALTSRGLLTLAAAAVHPAVMEFGAYVPGLPGDTLTMVEPGGVLVLTLAEDARISVSGQSAVDVAADTPTFFALGADVSVEVIEHDP